MHKRKTKFLVVFGNCFDEAVYFGPTIQNIFFQADRYIG